MIKLNLFKSYTVYIYKYGRAKVFCMLRTLTTIILFTATIAGCASQPKVLPRASDRNEVDSAIRQERSRFRLCYEQAIRIKKETKGKVVTAFVIDLNGNVTNARIDSSKTQDKVLDECILGVLKTIKFTPDTSPVTIKYPFFFDNKL